MRARAPSFWPRRKTDLRSPENALSISGAICKCCSTNPSKRRKPTMRFMIIVKATKDSEAGVMPSAQLRADMDKFNQELMDAGVFVDAAGLQASSKGARVTFSERDRAVTMGPLSNIRDLVAGYWIWKVKSLDEAIEWVKRCPNPMLETSDIEIRQLFEMEDFA